MVGGRLTPDEVVARVARDLPFYRNSGGGVTVSGGEPLAQPAFLRAVLEGCRGLGIHTALETCGQAPAEVLRAVEPLVDLFLFDLKLASPEAHRELTGLDNRLILANLRWLSSAAPGRVVLRFPLVPGATDDEDNVRAVAALAAELGVGSVQLEPYHGLGVGKYGEIGLASPPLLPTPGPEQLARVAAVFEAAGLRCEPA